MSFPQLSPQLTRSVLRHLGLVSNAPDLPFLQDLVDNHVRQVPFETASRIVKRARTAQTGACPRWPEEFWQASLQHGCGGTCFESHYAFFALLRTLKYEGYLTINHMRDHDNCHAAIVLSIDEAQWLVDVSLPLYAPVRLEPDTMTAQATPFMNYTAQPDAASAHYRVERAPHPFPYAYTLVDKPVSNPAYRTALTNDYGEGGFFLDRLVINKVVNGLPWRFDSAEEPWRLNVFENGIRTDHVLNDDAAAELAQHFGINSDLIREALDHLSFA